MSNSFLEKLKKGMEIEESIEEKPSEAGNSQRRREGKEEKKKGMKKTKESKIKTLSIGLETGKREKPNTDKAMEKEKVQIKKPPAKDKPSSAPSFVKATAAPSEAGDSQRRKEGKEKWPEPEGQLAVDVYQTESELVIQSAIAGVKPEDLTISIEKDIFTIRGERKKSSEEGGDYFTQECYWGPFSREIILPVEIDPNRVEASMKEGILTIRMPKILREKKRKIAVKG